MIPDNVMMTVWLIVFFAIFYVYIDVRIERLRDEMLYHYSTCESLLQGKNIEKFESIVPTREETARCLSDWKLGPTDSENSLMFQPYQDEDSVYAEFDMNWFKNQSHNSEPRT
jgi:hypothetical protein